MSLAAGQRLNGYEIVALVGAGGMGEVYRARDTRLHREVALKVLPAHLAGDAAAFARFEREARAVAALSHPNILAVHDFGRTDAMSYVVFELLQGASLRERLASGPLPVRKAIDIARQVADGLAAAHERHITHRDIKPDNLFVSGDGRVKILDFGLAQTAAREPRADDATGTAVPPAAPITGAGTVLGTVGYMAPEQVRGQAVDHRADIFALGATLYELCSGRRAFRGETPADTMSAVLSSDPPELTTSGQPTPPALERIVRRCLEKQPAERFQSARDLSFALEALSSLSGTASSVPAAPAASARSWAAPVAAALVALVAGAAATRAWWPAPAPATALSAPSVRAEFESAIGASTSMLLALSPDGRYLGYSDVMPGTGLRQLALRALATAEVTPVPDSEGAFVLDWTPDSTSVFFAARDGIRRFAPGDRTSTVTVRGTADVWGAAVLGDHAIVVAGRPPDVLRRIAADGTSTVVLRADGETYSMPRRIGTRSDVLLAVRNTARVRHVVIVRLRDGQVTPLAETEGAALVASGHLLITRADGMYAAPFDMDRLVLTGEPARITDAVVWDSMTSVSSFTATDSGVAAFRPRVTRPLQFEWLDHTGRSLGLVGAPGFYTSFALSPDGARIVTRTPPTAEARRGTLRVIDIERGVVSPITAPPGNGVLSDPIWAADGTHVVYKHGDQVMRQLPSSTTADIWRREPYFPDAFSRDGRWLLAGRPMEGGAFGIFAVPADAQGDAVQLYGDGPAADEASFSPDGRLVSFQSTQTGRAEVFLTPFPPTGERWQVSADGGVQARWSPDGRSLYYLDLEGRLVRVPVEAGAPPKLGRSEVLFDLGIGVPSLILEQYAVHRDRFLVMRPSKDAAAPTVAVLSNWMGALLAPPTAAAR